MLRPLLLAFLFILTLLPLGWNKFDITQNAQLIYLIGASLPILVLLSWKSLTQNSQSIWPQRILLLAIIGFIALSYFFSPIKNYGWSEALMMIAGVILYFIAQTFSPSERKFFIAIFAGATFISILVSLYWYTHFSENRMAGLFFDAGIKSHFWPNAFALFLLMAWPCTLYFLKNRWKLLVSLIFAALILTFSRAAFLTFLVQIFAFFIWQKSRTKNQSLGATIPFLKIAGITVLTLFLVFIVHEIRQNQTQFKTNSFQEKIIFEGTERQTSVTERFQFFQGGANLAVQKPLLGHGPGSFRFQYPPIQPEFLATSDHPHNWYLKIALENGIPAAILFLVFLGITLTRRKTEEGMYYVIALLGPMVHGLVDYNLNFLTLSLLFWILLGFSRTARSAAEGQEEKNNSWRIILLLLSSAIALSAFSEAAISYKARDPQNQKIYENAQFSREYWFNQARLARSQNKLEESQKLIEKHLGLNHYDAFAWNFLGQLFEKQNQSEKAYSAYKKAVQNDPMNFFVFYVDWFKMAEKLGIHETDLENYKTKAREILQKYPEKIRQNIHYTAQSTNPEYAMELAKILKDEKLEKEIRAALSTKLLDREKAK